jgi:hypothetical protein
MFTTVAGTQSFPSLYHSVSNEKMERRDNNEVSMTYMNILTLRDYLQLAFKVFQ